MAALTRGADLEDRWARQAAEVLAAYQRSLELYPRRFNSLLGAARAAKAAGVHSVAVTWGRIHPRERLEAEEPDTVVDTAEELLAVL